MKTLSFEEIKSITLGANRFEEINGELFFRRFSEKETVLYETAGKNRGYSTAGIKLSFVTNSENLYLKINTSPVIARTYFSFDIYSDLEYVGSLTNFTDEEAAGEYTKMCFPLGVFDGKFKLPFGTKNLTIHFPHSLEASLIEMAIDDGASIEPIKYDKKILIYGDSITQGYDALHPSKRYAAKLSDALNAEEINKAVGGEVFNPRLSELKVDFKPDYITAAYGTNDWTNTEKDVFFARAEGFFKALAKNYPDTPIFALAPVWRADCDNTTCYGKFSEIPEAIKKATAGLSNVKFISAIDFIPHEKCMFGDGFLHPNDQGFDFYFKALLDKINEKK